MKDGSETDLKKKHTATNIYMYFIALSVKDICGSVSGKKSKTGYEAFLMYVSLMIMSRVARKKSLVS